MSLPMAEVALDLEDVFFVFSVFLNNVDVYTHDSKVVIAIFLATLVPKTSLVLVFLGSLALVSRRFLVLTTR